MTRFAPLVLLAVVTGSARGGRGADGLVNLRRVARGAYRAELCDVTDVGDFLLTEGHGLELLHASLLVAEDGAVAAAHQRVVRRDRRLAEESLRLVEPGVGELEQVGGVKDIVHALPERDELDVELGVIHELPRLGVLWALRVGGGKRRAPDLEFRSEDLSHFAQRGRPPLEHPAILLPVTVDASLLAGSERLTHDSGGPLGLLGHDVAGNALHAHLEHMARDHRCPAPSHAEIHAKHALVLILVAVAALELPKAMRGPGALGEAGDGGKAHDASEEEGRDQELHVPGAIGTPIGGGSLWVISLWQRVHSIFWPAT
jgi:hypothetical protein